jgi:hypothetical protein
MEKELSPEDCEKLIFQVRVREIVDLTLWLQNIRVYVVFHTKPL